MPAQKCTYINRIYVLNSQIEFSLNVQLDFYIVKIGFPTLAAIIIFLLSLFIFHPTKIIISTTNNNWVRKYNLQQTQGLKI